MFQFLEQVKLNCPDASFINFESLFQLKNLKVIDGYMMDRLTESQKILLNDFRQKKIWKNQ